MSTSIHIENSAVSTKTYLQQCEEDLDPSQLSSWQWKSTQWQAAAVTTLVAFTILAVGALALTVFYAPIYIPVVAISSALLLAPAQKGSKVFEQWADQARARAEQLKQISQHYQALSSATLPQLRQALHEKGIQWLTIPGMPQSPASLDSLKPLVARHTFWENRIQKLEEQKRTILTDASKLAAENYENNKASIYDLRCEALEIEKVALESKIKNSFVNAIIRRPYFKGSLEDIGAFSPMSGQERAVGNGASSGSATEFFTFKNGRTPIITVDEVKRMGISDLAMRLIPGMPAAL